jgi:hypothetical protein
MIDLVANHLFTAGYRLLKLADETTAKQKNESQNLHTSDNLTFIAYTHAKLFFFLKII